MISIDPTSHLIKLFVSFAGFWWSIELLWSMIFWFDVTEEILISSNVLIWEMKNFIATSKGTWNPVKFSSFLDAFFVVGFIWLFKKCPCFSLTIHHNNHSTYSLERFIDTEINFQVLSYDGFWRPQLKIWIWSFLYCGNGTIG